MKKVVKRVVSMVAMALTLALVVPSIVHVPGTNAEAADLIKLKVKQGQNAHEVAKKKFGWDVYRITPDYGEAPLIHWSGIAMNTGKAKSYIELEDGSQNLIKVVVKPAKASKFEKGFERGKCKTFKVGHTSFVIPKKMICTWAVSTEEEDSMGLLCEGWSKADSYIGANATINIMNMQESVARERFIYEGTSTDEMLKEIASLAVDPDVMASNYGEDADIKKAEVAELKTANGKGYRAIIDIVDKVEIDQDVFVDCARYIVLDYLAMSDGRIVACEYRIDNAAEFDKKDVDDMKYYFEYITKSLKSK